MPISIRHVLVPGLYACTLLFGTGFAATLAGAQPQSGNVDLPRYPAISPDGSHVTFSWRGDLWKVPASGGLALRLTSHPQDELHSAWSADGSRIAFTSDRDGYQNLFIMKADGTDVQQLTYMDRSLNLYDFGVDENGNEMLTFDASIEGDVYRSTRPYMISTKGGDIVRLHDAYGSEPTVRPDGQRIAFTRGGYYYGWSRRHYRGSEAMDVWIFDRTDESFTELTTWAGIDGKARWGGERTLLFLSDRELDTVNLYRMSAEDGEEVIARLTGFEGRDVHDFDLSADGSTAVLMVWDTLYTLDLNDPNAESVPLVITAVEDARDNYELKSVNREVSEAALNPGGKVLATIAYGRVYVRNIEDNSPTRRITDSHARCSGVAWSPDGVTLYYSSDEDGTDSIYAAKVAMTRDDIKSSFDEALSPPDEPDDGGTEEAADDTTDDAAPETDDNAGDPEDDDGDASENGEKKDAKKKRKLPKDRDPERWHDAITFTITPVVQTEHNDVSPTPSPDGKHLAFRRSRGDLMILDLESRQERRLVEGWDAWMEWRWSPDGRHIAYAQNDLNFNTDIYIVPVDGSTEPVNITQHPNNESNPRWSADGRILAFTSNRINREADVWMVYLDRSLETLTPKELEEYYEDAVKAATKRKPLDPMPEDDAEGDEDTENAANDDAEETDDDEDADEEESEAVDEPVEWSLDDAYLRLRRVTSMTGSESNLELTPGGDRYIFNGSEGSRGLYSVKWNGSDQKRLAGPVNAQHVTLSGDKVVYVSGGRAGTVSPTGGSAETIDIDDTLRLDLQAQSSQKFLEAARVLGEGFYHHDMKGLDWAALTEDYHALARQTRTADEFNYVANRFLGELNASHLGIRASGASSSLRQASGRLGVDAQRVTLPDGREGFEITHIVPDSPAVLSPTPLKIGDVITAINLDAFDAMHTLEQALQGLINEEVIVSIARPQGGAHVDLHTLITPISYGAEYGLRYDAWVEDNRARVAELSDGRIGYIHIQGMNQPSLDVYERDLYAAARGMDGLLIDVRNNGGGWTADRLLGSIMTQPHAYTIPRGAPLDATGHYPQDRLFIQRYILPVNMLCNEKSFSNAEIVSHAFKTLKRGTLVGQETYGGVISTGGTRLIDGTFVRMPFRGWYLLDGTDMEDRGAVPDLLVPQTPEAESRNEDEQLRAAVEDLLQRIE